MRERSMVRRIATNLTTLLMLVLAFGACGGEEDAPATRTPLPVLSGSPTDVGSATVSSTIVSATPSQPTVVSSPTLLSGSPTTGNLEVQLCTYEVVNDFPHDPDAFTQGLVYQDGRLYEGTGLYGESTLREVELETGEVLRRHALSPELFGEGITLLDGRIYQVTWQSQTAIVYDAETFEEIERFSYTTEGWGITDDGERLYMSDGSNTISMRSPETFDELDRIQVRDEDGPVGDLNELEWIDGQLYANVWQTDEIVRIDPSTGGVTARIDLSGLLTPEDQDGREVDVLNGIAWDEEGQRLFVTGKLWPRLYEIELQCS